MAAKLNNPFEIGWFCHQIICMEGLAGGAKYSCIDLT